MVKKKSQSRALDKATLRIDGIKAVNPKLSVGGFTVTGYAKLIEQLRNDISAYNTAVSTVNVLQNKIADTEKLLAEYSERMLLAVASQYGKNSDEYEMAGGVRKSDRKRPTRKVAVATS